MKLLRALVLVLAGVCLSFGQTTIISDTLYYTPNPTLSGTLTFNGIVRATPPVGHGSVVTSATGSGGALSMVLAPTSYTIDYLLNGSSICTERWNVPSSVGALTVYQVRGSTSKCQVREASEPGFLPSGGGGGSAGPTGPTGPAGSAATVAVGTTTTGTPGSSASVTNSGSSSAAVLNFTIPAGATGPIGPQGSAGSNGSNGSAGAPGAAATLLVGSTSTGAAGSNASVTNSGSSSAAVLNFTIPAGATGPTGPTGPAGSGSGTNAPGVAVSSSAPMLLYAHFRDDDQTLFNAYSYGGVYWTDTSTAGANSCGTTFRDPTVLYVNGTWYFAATGGSSSTVFLYWTSTDLVNYSTCQQISVSNSTAKTWAPEFFSDPVSGNYYLAVAYQPSSGSQGIDLMTFNPTTGAFGSPVAITPSGLSYDIFDPFIRYNTANSNYELWYTSSPGLQYINYATSSSLTGPYTVQKSNDFIGLGGQSEGQSILTLPNGCTRVYADTFSLASNSGRNY